MKSSHIYTFVLFVQKSKCCCLNLNDHLRRKLAVLSINGSVISKVLYWSGGLTEDVSGTETPRRTLTSNLWLLFQAPHYILLCHLPWLIHTPEHSKVSVMYRCVEHTCGFFRQAVHACQSNHLVCISSPLDVWKCHRHSSADLRYKTHSHLSHWTVVSFLLRFMCHSFLLPPPPLITCVSILLNPTKSGSDPAVLLLNRGNGHQMCPSSPGNEMHTRTHWQTNRRLSCSVECVVDESRGPNITAALCLLAVTSGAEVG